jgi:phosphate-selective porin
MVMKSRWLGVLLSALLLSVPAALAEEQGETEKTDRFSYDKGLKFESGDGRFGFTINNRAQIRFTEEQPDEGESESAFRIRRYKFKIEGFAFRHWKFKLQTNFASGSVRGNNDALLEDVEFQYSKHRLLQPWLGQGKAFFGRQELTSSGNLQFVDRSIASERFAAKRHIGVGLVGLDQDSRFEYNLGVYNGEGINRVDNPGDGLLAVGRAVWTPLGKVGLAESAFDYPESSRLAVGASAYSNKLEATTTNELVVVTDPGTGLPTGEVDTVTVQLLPQRDVVRGGVELAYKLRGFNAVAEWYTESQETDGAADADTDGGYAQVAYLFPGRRFEVAGRYSVISPDVSGPSADLTEEGVAVSYYLLEHLYKIQGDYRRLGNDATDADTDEFRLQFQFVF